VCFVRNTGFTGFYTNHNACKQPPLRNAIEQFHNQFLSQLAETLNKVWRPDHKTFCKSLADAVDAHNKKYTAKMKVLSNCNADADPRDLWAEISITGPKTLVESCRDRFPVEKWMGGRISGNE